MPDIIYQGEDKLFEVTITDPDLVAIDLDTIAGIIIYILDRHGNIVVKYSSNAQTGFETLTISDAVNGKVQFKLQSNITTTMVTGLVSADIKLEQEDAGYEDHTLHSVGVIIDIADIKETPTTAETDLTP